MRHPALAVLAALATALGAGGSAHGAGAPQPTDPPAAPPGPPDDSSPEPTDSTPTDEDLLVAALHDADGEVIVIEAKDTSPTGTASGREVGSEVIATTPARSTDDLLRLVPGLYISQHGAEGKGLQFFLRGFDAVHGSDIAVKVAGVPLNELSNVHGQGYVDLGFVMPEVVRSIHAHKGSFAFDQGSFATAGSLELELGVEERGTRVSYEAGSTNRHRLAAILAPRDRPAGSFTALEVLSDDGYGENRATRRASALAQERFERDDGDTWLELLAGGQAARFGEPGTTPLADVERGSIEHDETYDRESDGDSYRGLIAARAGRVGSDLRLSARAHAAWRQLELAENFTGYLLNPELGDRRAQLHRSWSGGLAGQAERDLARRLTLVAGAEGLLDRVSQRENQIDAEGMPWQDNRDLDALHLLGGLYAGLRAQLGRVKLEGGGRVDAIWLDVDQRAPTAGRAREAMATASPRLSAAWRLADPVRLFAAYGRGLRPPEARAVVGSSDPPAMAPAEYGGGAPDFTTSHSVETGGLYRADRRLSLSASGFGVWISDEMVFDHISGANLALNSTRRLGAELGAEARPVDWLRLRADLTATDARFTGSGAPVPSVPKLLGTGEVGLLHPAGWRGGAQMTVIGPRPLAHGATAASQAVLNLVGGRRLGRFDLELSVDNALASRWREGEYHYASWFDTSQPRSTLPRIHYSAGRPFGVRAALTATF